MVHLRRRTMTHGLLGLLRRPYAGLLLRSPLLLLLLLLRRRWRRLLPGTRQRLGKSGLLLRALS